MPARSTPSPELPLVIVVDDDPAVRSSLQFALELEGFAVETLDCGEALLTRDLPERDACLVLDERMPGIGGLAALARLRGRQVALPALLITSNPKRAVRQAAAAAGVPIVEKPLVGDALSGWIRAALRG
ncbi:response regulator transcription factor [Phenylobacterium sp.]|jgi:FixJ family two-component response regulator|uniref:response regulator transcription factor n=1 Tax=Phenylobacterium sp. TaxID=1871053 RepID=UPI002F94689F